MVDGSQPVFPLADNEIAYLKSIEVFMRGRCSPFDIVTLIPTNSIIRVAIEKRTYVESNLIRERY